MVKEYVSGNSRHSDPFKKLLIFLAHHLIKYIMVSSSFTRWLPSRLRGTTHTKYKTCSFCYGNSKKERLTNKSVYPAFILCLWINRQCSLSFPEDLKYKNI